MNHPHHQPVPQPPAASPGGRSRGRLPGWAIGLIITAVAMIVLVLVAGGWFIYKLDQSPDTFVYEGNHIPSRFVDAARDEGLVADDETVLFFYSDAMFDVREAMYVLTDKHLVLLNREWSDPQAIIAFSEIVDVSASWSSQWITDSWISVELQDGTLWTFPLSMENGRDRRFVDKLCESAGLEPLP